MKHAKHATETSLEAAVRRAEKAEEELLYIPRPEIARLMRLSESRVCQLTTEGVFHQTPEGRFPRAETVETIARILHDRSDESAMRIVERQRKVELLDLTLAGKRGESIKVADVEKAWADIILKVRDRFRRIGAKISPRLPFCKSEIEMEKIINEEIDEALAELARPVDYRQPEIRNEQRA